MAEWDNLIDFPDYEMNRAGTILNYHTKREIEPSWNGKNSLKINLRKDGKVYTRSVARLVCRQYHGEPEYGDTVIFRDNNTRNIHADNLKWGTRSFAWEWTHQNAKGEPAVDRPIERLATGDIYPNSLAAAIAVEGIERYIVLATRHPDAWWYRGSLWQWADQEEVASGP